MATFRKVLGFLSGGVGTYALIRYFFEQSAPNSQDKVTPFVALLCTITVAWFFAAIANKIAMAINERKKGLNITSVILLAVLFILIWLFYRPENISPISRMDSILIPMFSLNWFLVDFADIFLDWFQH